MAVALWNDCVQQAGQASTMYSPPIVFEYSTTSNNIDSIHSVAMQMSLLLLMHVVSANDDRVGLLALISSMLHSVSPYDNVRCLLIHLVCECFTCNKSYIRLSDN